MASLSYLTVSDNATTNEAGSPFHFLKNLRDIFADQSDGKEVQCTKKENQ